MCKNTAFLLLENTNLLLNYVTLQVILRLKNCNATKKRIKIFCDNLPAWVGTDFLTLVF